MKIPRSPPAAVMLTNPKMPLIARLGRSGEDDAKPEDQPVSQYQQLRWEVGCPKRPVEYRRVFIPTTLKGSGMAASFSSFIAVPTGTRAALKVWQSCFMAYQPDRHYRKLSGGRGA